MPKLEEDVVDALNAQLGRELAASHEYLAMAIHFDGRSLDQLADFFYRQADEEREHAMKFVHYLLEAGETPRIPEVPEPKASFSSAEEAARISLQQEQEVTRHIYELVDLAAEHRDHATSHFLDWFVDEQLEEESTFGKLVDIIDLSTSILEVEDYVARMSAGAGE